MSDELRLNDLVADYMERRISRRGFMRRAVALGVGATSAAAILAACGDQASTEAPTSGNRIAGRPQGRRHVHRVL